MKTTDDGDGFHDRVAARVDALSPRERAVTDFFLDRPSESVTASAAEIAALTATSDATVVRTARSLGYSGLRELKRAVMETLTIRRDPARVLDGRLEHLGGERALDRVASDGTDLLRRLPSAIDADAFDAAVGLIEGAERVVAYGIGPAAATAQYLAIEIGRLGRRATVSGATGFRLADDLLGIGPGDVAVVLAPLRLFREVDALMDRASEVGAPVVAVTEALAPALRARADAVLALPSSTSGAAGEHFASWVAAHALAVELAARDRSGSVAARQTLNRLRTAVARGAIDADAPAAPDVGLDRG